MKLFTKRVRERAKSIGLPLAEVARRAGLSERRFGHYASGRSEPDLASLIRIAEALDTTPNQLLGIEDAVDTADDVLRRQVSAAVRLLDDHGLRVTLATVTALIEGRAR
jgi:transcriptional regulator with XRE-family HTH domain